MSIMSLKTKHEDMHKYFISKIFPLPSSRIDFVGAQGEHQDHGRVVSRISAPAVAIPKMDQKLGKI